METAGRLGSLNASEHFTYRIEMIYQSYTLMSSDTVGATRVACKKALESIGCSVIIENADAIPVLKCRVNNLIGSLCTYHLVFFNIKLT